MPPPSRKWQRRIAAAEAALTLLEQQGIDQTQQIDVFDLCERLGLWLAFAPLDNLLGAFIPEGSGGVLITTQRPLTVQRYTAAHELGHWRLDHGPSTDDHDQVLGATHAEREQLAQVFAGNLLLPPPLAFSLLEWIRSGSERLLTPRDCYVLAREAGVSYEAAIWQLVNLEVLTVAQAREMFGTRPLSIKTDLAYGRRPVNGWADVWLVDEAWDDEILDLRIEDEAVISLPENRSTGYRWMLADDPEPLRALVEPPPTFAEPFRADDIDDARDQFFRRVTSLEPHPAAPPAMMRDLRRRTPSADVDNASPEAGAGIDVVGDQYLTSRVPSVRPRDARQDRLEVAEGDRGTDRVDRTFRAGTTGRRLLGVRFGIPGAHTIRLVYRSPFTEGPDLRSYVIHAFVETRRTGISVEQLATEEDDEGWVRTVHDRQKTAVPPALDPDDPKLAE